MAGKSIEESQAARRKRSKDKSSEKPKDPKDPKQKISLSFKDVNGLAFIITNAIGQQPEAFQKMSQ